MISDGIVGNGLNGRAENEIHEHLLLHLTRPFLQILAGFDFNILTNQQLKQAAFNSLDCAADTSLLS